MNWNSTDSREIRRFGLIALVFFGCLCGLGVWMKKPIPTYLFGALSILGLCFTLTPRRLSPVYGVWMKVAHFLGRLLTTLLLTLSYFAAITPTALIKRLFTGSPLPLKPDKEALSYWVARTEPSQPNERFLKRY